MRQRREIYLSASSIDHTLQMDFAETQLLLLIYFPAFRSSCFFTAALAFRHPSDLVQGVTDERSMGGRESYFPRSLRGEDEVLSLRHAEEVLGHEGDGDIWVIWEDGSFL